MAGRNNMNKTDKINAITFDLDNTLIDFIKMKRYASNMAAEAMVRAGLDMSLDIAKEELFSEYLKDIEGNHAFQDYLKQKGIKSERLLAAAINAHQKAKFKHMKPFSGVKKMLISLREKGIKLGVVTDAPRLKAYQRLDAMDLVDMFDVIVGKEDTGRLKPSSLPFRRALKLLGSSASETIHVGDWPEKDILGARKVGMKTCFARYGYLWKGKIVYADYKVKKPSDLIELVERINSGKSTHSFDVEKEE